MRRVIIIVGLLLGFIFVSQAQEDCDTLKFKTIKTNYGNISTSSYNIIGELNGAIINVDTLPVFNPEIVLVNISNDTFFSDEHYDILIIYSAHADTGILAMSYVFTRFSLNKVFYPNDTTKIGFALNIDLLEIINGLKEIMGISFEEISYWETVAGIGYTNKDGYYSDSVFFASADTSIFYVVKGSVGIAETHCNASVLRVFPNPTSNQLKITNYELRENTEYQIFSVVGQVVMQGSTSPNPSKGGEFSIDVSHLASGLYFLKVDGKVVRFVKE